MLSCFFICQNIFLIFLKKFMKFTEKTCVRTSYLLKFGTLTTEYGKENEEILKLTENHEWAEYICLGVKGNIKSDGTYTEAIKEFANAMDFHTLQCRDFVICLLRY